jgi:hypothetical protein
MPLTVQCPGCTRTLRVPENLAGQRGKCPACGGFLDIPGADAPPPEAAYSLQPPPPPRPAAPSPGAPPGFNPYAAGDLDFSEQLGRPRGALVAPETFGKLFWGGFGLVLLGVCVMIGFVVVSGAMEGSSQRSSRSSFQDDDFDFGQPNRPYRPTTTRSSSSDASAAVALIGILIGALVMLAGIVLNYIFLYKCWDLIQDGRARTSPGKAVGFMFIPFFNWYWQFVALRGLAEDLNLYSRRYRLQAREAPVGILTAACILVLCGLLPFVGGCAQLIGAILLFIGMLMVKSTVQDIAAARMAAP